MPVLPPATALPDAAIAGSAGVMAMFAILLVVTLATHGLRAFWPIVTLAALAIVNNALLLTDHLATRGVLAIVSSGLVIWVCVDRIRNEPHSLRALLGAKESDWSRERHDLKGLAAGLRGENELLRDRLASIGGSTLDIPRF